ncbi:MAG: metal ABC transporter solute-binding protein, Zn/Mn family [Phycisphaerales bacterium JB064]
MKIVRIATIVLASGLPLTMLPISGCGVESSTTIPASTQNVVLTTFYPTQYFAEHISGGLVPVRCLLPADEDPIFWKPDADTIGQYQNAKLVITNGAEFEKWVAGAALPRGRTVSSLSNDALQQAGGAITMEGSTHSHGAAGEHTHEGVDGHTWVSPKLAVIQARRIAEAMSNAWPEHAEAFKANLGALVEDLEMLQTSLEDLTTAVKRHRVLASHPAYNYLARDLGWDVTNFDFDPESEDVAGIVADVRAAIEGDTSVIMLWEGEPTDAIRDALRDELGVTSVLFSPAEGVPDEGDYMDVMRANLDRLRQAVGG